MTPDRWLANLPTRAKIINMMTEKHRVYHNLSHAMELAWLAFGKHGLLTNTEEDLIFFYLTAFYHDIVYDPTRKDNEERSAQEFVNDLDILGFDTSHNDDYKMFKDVRKAIQLTANHFHPSAYKQNARISHFLDLDLWGLGADWHEYRRNNEKIKIEYYVADDVWISGRSQWIETALATSKIYRQNTTREQQARENLIRELKILGKGDGM